MRRRDFIAGLSGATLAWPLKSVAQQTDQLRRIGILSPFSKAAMTGASYRGLLDGLRNLGYVEGRSLAIEWRFANNDVQRLPALVAELVNAKVEVIVTQSTPAVSAASKATKRIPIVALTVGDPVGSGFAASLARPGGNVTGTVVSGEVLSAKRLELLAELAPGVSRVAVLINPDNAYSRRTIPEIKALTEKSGKEIVVIYAHNLSELNEGLSGLVRQRLRAFIVTDESFFLGNDARIVEIALQAKLISIFPWIQSVEAGGLLSYSIDYVTEARRLASYVDQILKGARPGELPFQRPEKFQLTVNLKTARAIGITVPQSIIGRADRVIE